MIEKSAAIFIFFIGCLLGANASAKCMPRQSYECVKPVFKRKIQDRGLITKEFLKEAPSTCEGVIMFEYGNKEIEAKVVFDRRSDCPEKGTKLSGKVEYLCQDEGRYTPADWTFTEMKCGLD